MKKVLVVLGTLAISACSGANSLTALKSETEPQKGLQPLRSAAGMEINARYAIQKKMNEKEQWSPLLPDQILHAEAGSAKTVARAILAFDLSANRTYDLNSNAAVIDGIANTRNEIHVTTFCDNEKPETYVVRDFNPAASWHVFGAVQVVVPTLKKKFSDFGNLELTECKTEIAVSVEGIFEVDPLRGSEAIPFRHNFRLNMK